MDFFPLLFLFSLSPFWKVREELRCIYESYEVNVGMRAMNSEIRSCNLDWELVCYFLILIREITHSSFFLSVSSEDNT
jgi:hypothetical protein